MVRGSTRQVDVELAVRAAKAMTDALNETLGSDVGRSMLAAEQKRRLGEVHANGADVWCADQSRQPAIAPIFKRTPGEEQLRR